MAILTILVRHAKASLLDTTQKLSDSGKDMQKMVNSHLKNELQIEPNEIWTSPILRAKETAELLGQEFGLVPQEEIGLGELELFDELAITNRLKEMPDESTIILVSHAPQIMRLASYWVGTKLFEEPPDTSTAVFLEFPRKIEPGTARFVRMVTYLDIARQKRQ